MQAADPCLWTDTHSSRWWDLLIGTTCRATWMSQCSLIAPFVHQRGTGFVLRNYRRALNKRATARRHRTRSVMVGISFKSCEDSVASLVRLDSALFGAGLALLGKPPLASVSVPRVFDLSTRMAARGHCTGDVARLEPSPLKTG